MAAQIIEIASYIFIFVIGAIALWVAFLYCIDITQTKHAIRRNYPVIGRFRYFFEHLGEFFRQYFFALDREEMPFNRAQRSWVYRAAKNLNNTVAFGSTKDLTKKGTVFFVNAMFPNNKKKQNAALTIGSKYQYSPKSYFNISGMSYGALSKAAVTALSKGAAKAGIWLNTGEGGLSNYHLMGGCDIVFQIGTAKFGVRDEEGNLSEAKLKEIAEIPNVKMFEIKLSQGAKPGKGGMLPAKKVTEEIAKIRHIEIGKAAISPPHHKEASTASELINFLNHIRDLTQKPVGLKLCVGRIEDLADLCEAVKAQDIESAPDFLTIDSSDGGTGAAPLSHMDNVGLPIKESLGMVVNILESYDLRERVKIIASGKLINPSDVAWALASGANFVNSARGFMFSLGCIQAMQCNKDTCPTGITTHNTKLQKGLDPRDKSERVANYAKNMVKEVEAIANSCGSSSATELTKEHIKLTA